jgi:hypothetical protein
MITKEQLEAIIKAVDEGGDGDDEISEEEVIAILRDHAPGEIPSGNVCLGAVSKSPALNSRHNRSHARPHAHAPTWRRRL